MKKKHERLILVSGVFCIAAGLMIWISTAFKENMLYFITPSDLLAVPLSHPAKQGKKFRLGGLVQSHSVKRQKEWLFFTVIDAKKTTQAVRFLGIPPELFSENKGVIAEGVMQNGVFLAERLLAKHDENYKQKSKT